MNDRDEIIRELKQLDLTEQQFQAALERRLSALAYQNQSEDDDEGYCSACVL